MCVCVCVCVCGWVGERERERVCVHVCEFTNQKMDGKVECCQLLTILSEDKYSPTVQCIAHTVMHYTYTYIDLY